MDNGSSQSGHKLQARKRCEHALLAILEQNRSIFEFHNFFSSFVRTFVINYSTTRYQGLGIIPYYELHKWSEQKSQKFYKEIVNSPQTLPRSTFRVFVNTDLNTTRRHPPQGFSPLVGLFCLRLPALLACLWLPCFGNVTMPQISLDEDEKDLSERSADISFSIPNYTPSNHEIEAVAACLILEAASQGSLGMRGVMSVIRNRARGLPELFAPTVLRPMQFSAFNRVTSGREPLSTCVYRAKNDRMWLHAVSLVKEALNSEWHDPTGGATHYTRSGERTRWTHRLKKTATISNHSFYK